MRFAKIVFIAAGVWGIVVLTPLYFLVDLTGRQYAPPTMYPQFFYGFLSVAMAWQIAFLVIGSSPARFRPLMIPSIVEKFGHVVGVAVLYGQARISAADAMAAGPDLLLGVLFIAAFAKTSTPRSDRTGESGNSVVRVSPIVQQRRDETRTPPAAARRPEHSGRRALARQCSDRFKENFNTSSTTLGALIVFVMMPNAVGAEMSRPGGPKLGWFSALNASILNSA